MEDDFAIWNNTTSVVTLPAKIVGQDNGLLGIARLQLSVQFKTVKLSVITT